MDPVIARRTNCVRQIGAPDYPGSQESAACKVISYELQIDTFSVKSWHNECITWGDDQYHFPPFDDSETIISLLGDPP